MRFLSDVSGAKHCQIRRRRTSRQTLDMPRLFHDHRRQLRPANISVLGVGFSLLRSAVALVALDPSAPCVLVGLLR